jgi:hypothetical protein
MSDEQTIYIGPEDDLTSVRERLEHISSRHVTLVLPTQTQLRSHVAWKLLHARARELGKDVLIVSSDPQIRSVAQAVKFRVVPSLEASSAGAARSRPTTNRPTRNGPNGRNRPSASSSTRIPTNRDVPPSRSTSSGRLRPQSERDYAPPRRTPQTPLPQEQTPGHSEPEETLPRGLNNTFDLPTDHLREYNDVPPSSSHQASPGLSEPLGNTSSYIHPIRPDQIEEPDDLVEDFNKVREIREAASRGEYKEPDSTPPIIPGKRGSNTDALRSNRLKPFPHLGEDPFLSMDDSHPSRIPEQRASSTLDSFDTGESAVQDISDIPTEVTEPEVEDLGDQGALPLYTDSPPSWHGIPQRDAQEKRRDQEIAENARSYGAPRSRSNTGSTKNMPPVTRRQDFDSEDALPPVAERPTQVTPIVPSPAFPAASSAARPPAPASRPLSSQPQRRPPLSRPQRREVRLQPPLSQPGARASYPSRPASQKATRRISLNGVVIGTIVILFFLLVGALAYLIPSADVTLTVPTRNFSHAVKLTAIPKASQKAAPGNVYADVLTKDFTRSGTGTATGSARIDTALATGSAIFTNNGLSDVTIPSGIVVATAGPNSQQFVTMAEAVVLHPGSTTGNSIEIPIQAQKPGTTGNVDAGMITVIPDDSLNQIATANTVASPSLKLQVSNPKPTTGGGAGKATVVSRADLDNVTKSLQAALNDDINAWVQQQKPSSQDVVGKPAISGSLINPPSEGQVATNGSFPAQFRATVTLMIVRSANLQDATATQLRNDLSTNKAFNGYTINPEQQTPVTIQALKTAGQGTSLTLSFTAIAKTMPNIPQDQVRTLVAGKLTSDASDNLKTLHNIQGATIKTSPGFVFWVSSLPSHININLVPGSVQK